MLAKINKKHVWMYVRVRVCLFVFCPPLVVNGQLSFLWFLWRLGSAFPGTIHAYKNKKVVNVCLVVCFFVLLSLLLAIDSFPAFGFYGDWVGSAFPSISDFCRALHICAPALFATEKDYRVCVPRFEPRTSGDSNWGTSSTFGGQILRFFTLKQKENVYFVCILFFKLKNIYIFCMLYERRLFALILVFGILFCFVLRKRWINPVGYLSV